MQYDKSMKQIKKMIQGMAGKYSTYNIFKDFIVLAACTISNHCDMSQWEKREQMYMDIIKKYERSEANKFAEMLALMTIAYEYRMSDFIGELYMTMEFGNKDSGQFFTPYNVSRLMADLTGYDADKDGIVTLNDPACGSGGLVVAYAETMKLADINYQTNLRVICNDIDFDVVRMCYIQLSLLGIDAIVEQRNTLAPLDLPPGEIWFTPMHLLNIHREKQARSNDRSTRMVQAIKRLETLETPKNDEIKEPIMAGPPRQMDIFDFLGG